MRSIMSPTPYKMLFFGQFDQIMRRLGSSMWHILWREELYTGFGKGSMQERELLGDQGIDGNIALKFY